MKYHLYNQLSQMASLLVINNNQLLVPQHKPAKLMFCYFITAAPQYGS
jgi:hypothetical protein